MKPRLASPLQPFSLTSMSSSLMGRKESTGMRSIGTEITIAVGPKNLHGIWTVPDQAHGVVVFAHGSGSSRHSPRNQFVASVLQEAGFATLLVDLLDEVEAEDRSKIFATDLLSMRVLAAIDWVNENDDIKGLPIGLFGASTGSAAALQAAARRAEGIKAIVSRGGRPDLAWHHLCAVKAPVLMIVGERDCEVLRLNREAMRHCKECCELKVIPNATHLFEEPGAMDQVAEAATQWFKRHLKSRSGGGERPFIDRADAGRRLAQRLQDRPLTDPIVLAIPRGGVVLGAVLAEQLHADLDVVLARKLRMPGNPEFALGAISEFGEVQLNVSEGELSPAIQSYLEREAQHQIDEIAWQRDIFRGGQPAAPVSGRSVIVVDDGIATGSTMIAALHTIRMQTPLEVIVAVPVAAPERLKQIHSECDEVICLIDPHDFLAVGQFYQDFTQVEDEEVVVLLKRAARQRAGAN
jgi:putative phosphoribosyl transferase